MPRPDFITNEDILRWSEEIDSDPEMGTLGTFAIIREVCYAGCWLREELQKLQCPEENIIRIQYTGGAMSFGHDAWEIHQNLLKLYKNNELEFEIEPSALN